MSTTNAKIINKSHKPSSMTEKLDNFKQSSEPINQKKNSVSTEANINEIDEDLNNQTKSTNKYYSVHTNYHPYFKRNKFHVSSKIDGHNTNSALGVETKNYQAFKSGNNVHQCKSNISPVVKLTFNARKSKTSTKLRKLEFSRHDTDNNNKNENSTTRATSNIGYPESMKKSLKKEHSLSKNLDDIADKSEVFKKPLVGLEGQYLLKKCSDEIIKKSNSNEEPSILQKNDFLKNINNHKTAGIDTINKFKMTIKRNINIDSNLINITQDPRATNYEQNIQTNLETITSITDNSLEPTIKTDDNFLVSRNSLKQPTLIKKTENLDKTKVLIKSNANKLKDDTIIKVDKFENPHKVLSSKSLVKTKYSKDVIGIFKQSSNSSLKSNNTNRVKNQDNKKNSFSATSIKPKLVKNSEEATGLKSLVNLNDQGFTNIKINDEEKNFSVLKTKDQPVNIKQAKCVNALSNVSKIPFKPSYNATNVVKLQSQTGSNGKKSARFSNELFKLKMNEISESNICDINKVKHSVFC
uniref:Uncharacterized protein n=1 Tax=Dermatophagoides pteronyssinus TaxID=6956 RepID=A0A6P6YBM6_DERPT|nr:putative uncharacterized protein DDB_G0282499 [Dermatophagoides pteronyssinus]